MQWLARVPIRYKILVLMAAAVLVSGATYTGVMVAQASKALLDQIDAKLLAAAHAVEYILPAGYHDRITDQGSVSEEQYRTIVDGFNHLCLELDLDYLWSVMVLDGKIVFTSATSPDKDVDNRRHAAFFEVHRDPAAFAPALQAMRTTYSTFHNEWGAGRMVLIPRRDRHGRTYILGASMKISELDVMLRRTVFHGLGIGFVIAALGVGASVLFARSLSAPLAAITRVAEHMAAGRLDTPIDASGSREIFTLARSFAAMRDAIREKMASLRDSQENLAITLNSIGDAVIATDARGVITRVNPIAETITGWPSSQAVGRPISDVMQIVNALTREPVASPVDVVLREGRVMGVANHTLLIARDGTERRVSDSGAPILNAEGRIVGAVLVFRDVTEEYRLQEQLRQAQKMEAVGQLAGGVAHDFNNVLTGISGNAELLRATAPEDSEQAAMLKQILVAAGRAKDLTRQLLSFSRKGQVNVSRVDLHATVHDVVRLLSHSIDRRIEMVESLGAGRHTVLGDASLLESAVLNLALNARDAMPGGGTLTFATRDVALDEEGCRAYSQETRPGVYVELSVTDTGVGMDARVQARLFEPFFTTKSEKGGTGLGLASVYGCVTSHHGAVRVDSQPGRGSTFTLLLPVAEGEQTAEEAPQKPAQPRGGVGRVLVVDDEELVIGFLKRALVGFGYTVSACRDGAEAVAFYRGHHAEIDLVILDLVMPKMAGAETFAGLKEINPQARVLIASGFSQPSTVSALRQSGAVGFLSKPFRLDELAQSVARHIQG